MNERDLLKAVKNEDEQAFRRLYESKRDRLFWICYRMVGNSEDARDIVQTVFMTVWRKVQQYNERYAVDAWLYRIAVNASIDYLRKEQRMVSFDERLFSPPLREAESPWARRELERILQRGIQRLPPRQRATFLLREVESFSTEETAFILRKNPSTVRSHLQHAKVALRRFLRTEYPETTFVQRTSDKKDS